MPTPSRSSPESILFPKTPRAATGVFCFVSVVALPSLLPTRDQKSELDNSGKMTYSHLWLLVIMTSRSNSLPSVEPAARHLSPDRRQRRSAEIPERMFAAPLTLLTQNGFTKTTVEDITAPPHVGQDTLFTDSPA